MGREGGQCIRLTVLSPSCAECLESWEPQPPGTLKVCPGLLQGLLYLYLYHIRMLLYLIFVFPCIIIYGFIRTSLMQIV